MEIVMFKKFVMIAALGTLVGCSSVPLVKEETPIKTEFLGGSIKVVYDRSTGEVKEIESMATAKLVSSLPNAVDESFTVATMRARKQLIEFMKTEVESEKFTESIFDTLQKSDEVDRSKTESVNHNISQAVKQSIKQKSAGILKGTYVSEKVYDQSTKTVRVVVRSSDHDIEAAKRLARMMGN
jgi:hypothetical protein